VGCAGLIAPHTLGVGYDNIEHILDGSLTGTVLMAFCFMKLISWSVALGSGTSGGTLAPLFTIGGGLGAVTGASLSATPAFSTVDPRIAALVGMAAMFAGSSRAFLTSVIFAYEATHQQSALLPLLSGCASAYLISSLLMRNTIMTEKIARRGITVPSEYSADLA
jgi:H+/Cl- antiporter ClcA